MDSLAWTISLLPLWSPSIPRPGASEANTPLSVLLRSPTSNTVFPPSAARWKKKKKEIFCLPGNYMTEWAAHNMGVCCSVSMHVPACTWCTKPYMCEWAASLFCLCICVGLLSLWGPSYRDNYNRTLQVTYMCVYAFNPPRVAVDSHSAAPRDQIQTWSWWRGQGNGLEITPWYILRLWRKPEHPKRAHAGMGEHADCTQKGPTSRDVRTSQRL